jgi:cytochrome d ubiquinol oxidase subunit I
MLSRIQFGISIGFHYLFPITTLGLTFFIIIFESLYLFKKNSQYEIIASFLIKLLAVTFALGVATGIMMVFGVGANWSGFSAFAGGVFGIHLAVESITAFALESVFLAILVFGRSRVSPKLFWFSALMVFFGSHLSAFWIVSANSWMQTPSGFVIENGRAVLTSFWSAIFNPSMLIRFIHVVSSTWLAGSVIVSGIAGFYLIKDRYTEIAKTIIRTAIIPFIFCSLLQAGIGHIHILQVKEYQPAKNSAYEGVFSETKGAPLLVFGIPDAKNRTIHFGFGIPYMLSFLETGRFDSVVEGLDRFPESDWPPVNVIFTTFHLMVMIGGCLIAVGLMGGFLIYRKKLYDTKWYLRILVAIVPLPYIASELGWVGAEMGRQPWIINGILRTVGSSSVSIPYSSMVVSLVSISLVYAALFALYLIVIFAAVKKGPVEKMGVH